MKKKPQSRKNKRPSGSMSTVQVLGETPCSKCHCYWKKRFYGRGHKLVKVTCWTCGKRQRKAPKPIKGKLVFKTDCPCASCRALMKKGK